MKTRRGEKETLRKRMNAENWFSSLYWKWICVKPHFISFSLFTLPWKHSNELSHFLKTVSLKFIQAELCSFIRGILSLFGTHKYSSERATGKARWNFLDNDAHIQFPLRGGEEFRIMCQCRDQWWTNWMRSRWREEINRAVSLTWNLESWIFHSH